MKLTLNTAITINASPSEVWSILTNFEAYANWNPFIKSITGVPKKGNYLKAHIQDMKFKPEVLVFDVNKEFRWKGKLMVKGIFDGEHYFQLTENSDGTTDFKHGENFSGILVRAFKKNLVTKVKVGFEEMNKALKKEAEK